MASNPIGINLGTQEYVNFDKTGTVNTQVVDIRNGTLAGGTLNSGTVDLLKAGTISKLEGGTLGEVTNLVGGTVTRILQGSIQITAGTVINNGGTVGLITRVGAIGTLEVGTISAMPQVSVGTIPNTPGGTLGLVTRVGNVGTLEFGTITSVANLAGGTVTRLVDGTVRIPAGTITSVTDIANLSKGTITRLEQGSVNVTAGTVVVTSGSMAQTAGTINTGTINVGTFRLNPAPTQVTQSYGTTTNGTVGTLVAAPSAGSAIFITKLSINVQSGTVEPLVSFGLATNGLGVVERGNYAAGGGISTSFPIPNSANNTGTALTFNILSGSGTVSYNLAYFVAVP